MNTINLSKITKILFILSVAFLTGGVAFAESGNSKGGDNSSPKQIIITANRVETDAKKTGSSVTVIDAETIQKSQRQTVADVLRGQPGVDVVQTGGPGGNTSIFMRGTNSEHTLVLIDGIEVNNPINNSRSFNFNDLSLENVERIEIIRGPQSTIYGSDAIGGVINIITKKGTATPQSNFVFESGSYGLFRESANTSGRAEKLSYSVGASREDFGGVSSAHVIQGASDDDGFENNGVNANLSYELTDNIQLNSVSKFQRSHADLDNVGGEFGDDPNRFLNNQTFFQKAGISGDFFQSVWKPEFNFTYSDHELKDKNDPDQVNTVDSLRSRYNGEIFKYDFFNAVKITDSLKLVGGLTTEEEKGSSFYRSVSSFGPYDEEFSERTLRTNSAYLQSIIDFTEDLSTSLGARIDDNSKFGSETTWRATSSYKVDEAGLRLLGSIGTGFKAPSLYQLYSQYGSLLLDSEKSLGWDVGFEKTFLDGLVTASSTYFQNSLDNLISFDPNTFIFFNINEVKTKGLESAVTYKCYDNYSLKLVHTYTDATDESTNQALLRRPNNKYRIQADYNPTDKLTLGIFSQTVGSRWDNDFNSFPAQRVKLASFTTFNAYASYKLTDTLSLFTKLDNIFDKEYEEVLGFSNLGFSATGGVRMAF